MQLRSHLVNMQVTRRTLSSSPSLCSARSRTRSRANCSFPSNLSASFLNASLMSSCVGTGGDGVCIRGGALTLASALHLSLLPLSLSSFLRSHRSPLPLSLQLLRMSPLQANRSRANEATGTMHLTTLHQEARLRWCTFNSASSPAVLLRSSSKASAMALRLTSLSAYSQGRGVLQGGHISVWPWQGLHPPPGPPEVPSPASCCSLQWPPLMSSTLFPATVEYNGQRLRGIDHTAP